MTALDIILIIIGIIIVIISYVVSETLSSEKQSNNVKEIWTDKEEMTIKDRVENIISDRSEMIIGNTEEHLCHLSNEKIMEFKEYSDQVLVKIEENHKQSVFLYNMLNEKQNEMKDWVNQLDKKHVEIENCINKMQEGLIQIETDGILTEKANSKAKKSMNVINSENEDISKKSHDNEENSTVKENDHTEKIGLQDELSEQPGEVRNDKILNLWNDGKTILEISKQLGIGQGEVKLVVDLFKGA